MLSKRIINNMLLCAFGIALTAAARYLPARMVIAGLSIVVLVSLTLSFISIRKKAAAAGPQPGLQKVSTIVIYSSAVCVFVSLLLIVFHMRGIGRPMLNFSLMLFIAGAVIGMFVPIRSDAATRVNRKQSLAIRIVIYSGTILSVLGVLLKLNHYRVGKSLMFAGAAIVFGCLLTLIAYGRYKLRSSKQ